jgi:hypothetical protein
MFYKLTKKLFSGIYQYKIVLVCSGAQWFRSNDMNEILSNLEKIKQKFADNPQDVYSRSKYAIRSQPDLDYALQLHHQLTLLKNIDLRIETPWVTIYTNNKKDIDAIIKIDESKVKYVSMPPIDSVLEADTIILPKINFDYRVTLGKTTQDYSAFISWAGASSKLKLTKTCKRDLLKPRSWGGSYFYVTGDNNLLMVRMHLGGCISKVERIINSKA